jgi:hypothetical protein
LEGRFFFSSCIWCGEWKTLDIGFSMQVLLRVPKGGGGARFIFLSANRKSQGALSEEGKGSFSFQFSCFLMCSHDVPSKLQSVP